MTAADVNPGGPFESSAGTVASDIFGITPGFTSPTLTMEDVRDHLDEILDAEH